MGVCLSSGEGKQHKSGEAGHVDEDGNVQLSGDHQAYYNSSVNKTNQKSQDIKRIWEANQNAVSDEKKAVARFWFEFSQKASERLLDLRKQEKGDGAAEEEEKKQGDKDAKGEGEEKEGEASEKKEETPKKEAKLKDPKKIHTTFIKEVNNDLMIAVVEVYKAYATENDDGDLSLGKEKSLQLFDDLVRGSEDMAIPSIQMYTRYNLKYYASQNEAIEKMRTEFVEAAEKKAVDAVKVARKEALAGRLQSAMGAAKESNQDSLNALERAVEKAKAFEVDTEAAAKKLDELKEKAAKRAAAEDEKKKKAAEDPKKKEAMEKADAKKKRAR